MGDAISARADEPSHSFCSWETPRDEANMVVNSDDRQYNNAVQLILCSIFETRTISSMLINDALGE
jgi:hypothetical protein